MANEINNDKRLPRLRTFEIDIETRKKSGVSPFETVTKSGAIFTENGIRQLNTKGVVIVAIIVLIVGGGFLGIFKYFFGKEKKQIEENPQQIQIGKSYIKADLEKTINFSVIDSGSIISAIKKELETQRKSNSLLFLMIPQTLKEFTKFTGIKVPEYFIQNTHPSFNIFTAYHTGSSSVVFLLKTENFEKTYSSLLAWENDMWRSFSQFLSVENIKNISKFSFTDEIIKNHDSRVFKNNEGKAILAYSIFNKQFVIIATSRDALSMMLQRLIASPPK